MERAKQLAEQEKEAAEQDRKALEEDKRATEKLRCVAVHCIPGAVPSVHVLSRCRCVLAVRGLSPPISKHNAQSRAMTRGPCSQRDGVAQRTEKSLADCKKYTAQRNGRKGDPSNAWCCVDAGVAWTKGRGGHISARAFQDDGHSRHCPETGGLGAVPLTPCVFGLAFRMLSADKFSYFFGVHRPNQSCP